jgi:hypothetical protein
MRAIVAVAVMVGFALAGVQTFDMRFLDGSAVMAIPASAACTTNWQPCDRGRAQSLYWREWVAVGATDSARVKIDVQYAVKDTSKRISGSDTLISIATCNVLDTTATKPHVFNRQYYPHGIVRWVRYIVTGISGNSNVAYIGNLVLSLDDGL